MDKKVDGSKHTEPLLQAANDRELATREILQAISDNRDDEAPVFEAILENACRLCNAPLACLFLVNPERTHLTVPASYGTRTQFVDLINNDPPPLDPEQSISARAMVEKRPLQIADLSDNAVYRSSQPHRVNAIEIEGIRSCLTVPLMVGDEAIGAIFLYRREVSPFGENEVELVETFAAQAVIAIENVKQFRELQAKLEREAATSEILRVISQSRDNEQPVFDVILERASILCEAPSAGLLLGCMDDKTLTYAGNAGINTKIGDALKSATLPMDPNASYSARSILEGKLFQFDDMAASELYKSGSVFVRSNVDDFGIRSVIFAPLMGKNGAIGVLALFRQEVRPFDSNQVELIKSFAAQATIAIENVRQYRELRTRLEREAATKNILQVISQSRDDSAPVFEAILENAARLCSAPVAWLMLADKDRSNFVFTAVHGDRLQAMRVGETFPLDSNYLIAQTILEARSTEIPDLMETESYRNREPVYVKLVEEERLRSRFNVPLLQNGVAIGCIVLSRHEPERFTADEITLVETFAAQAVIAIESVRQFKALETLNAELGERVEEQVGEIERMGRLKRFLPAAVADTVVSQGADKLLASHRALLGVLFCDIRGFTAFCESAEPEETIEVLQSYHEEMGKLIIEYNAGVDHRMGDGIMVLFNDPVPCDDPAGDAVRLALAMRTKMTELCKKWKRLGHRLGFGVGVSLGYATVGMVGYEGRYDYTASGTAVNLAARLCDRAEDGEILLSPRAYTAVEGDFSGEQTGEANLKGIREPVQIFRLLDGAE